MRAGWFSVEAFLLQLQLLLLALRLLPVRQPLEQLQRPAHAGGGLDEGAVLFITPDGPRGPMHTMNPGLAFMARATGREIVPLGFACDRAWHADSWDHFTIPKPFARVCVVYGQPVLVSREADDTEQGEATELVRERTLEAERAGFDHLGCEVDWPVTESAS